MKSLTFSAHRAIAVKSFGGQVFYKVSGLSEMKTTHLGSRLLVAPDFQFLLLDLLKKWAAFVTPTCQVKPTSSYISRYLTGKPERGPGEVKVQI